MFSQYTILYIAWTRFVERTFFDSRPCLWLLDGRIGKPALSVLKLVVERPWRIYAPTMNLERWYFAEKSMVHDQNSSLVGLNTPEHTKTSDLRSIWKADLRPHLLINQQEGNADR